MVYSIRITAGMLALVILAGCTSTEYQTRENSYFNWQHADKTENQWHFAVGYNKELDIIGAPESGIERYPVGFGDEISLGFGFTPKVGEMGFAMRLALLNAEAVYEGTTRVTAGLIAPSIEITIGTGLFKFHEALGPTVLFGGLSLMPAFYSITVFTPPSTSTNSMVFSPGGGIVIGLESYLTKDISVILKNTVGVIVPLSPSAFHIYDRVDLGIMCYPW